MTVFVAYGHKRDSNSLVISVYKAKAHASDNSKAVFTLVPGQVHNTQTLYTTIRAQA